MEQSKIDLIWVDQVGVLVGAHREEEEVNAKDGDEDDDGPR